MTVPPPSLRRAAAVGFLAVALALAWLLVATPLVSAWQEADAAVDRAERRLAALTALTAGAAALEQALRVEAAGAPAAYGGDSDTLVAAQVQDRLKAAVETAGGQLASVAILPTAAEGPFRRIGLRIQVEATLPQLQRLLYTLETGRPDLVLDNLSIRPPVRAGAERGEPSLAVEVDVQAYAGGARP
ncbi:MAG: type II secretion system protein M [Magnetospirillum sp.]|nr:type II secretion system protein M [Magnetospirillum sp.]